MAKEGDEDVCVPCGVSGHEEGARAGAEGAAWAVRRPGCVKGDADPQRCLGMLLLHLWR